MSAAVQHLVERAEAAGVRLSLVAGQVHVKAPRGALALLEELRTRRDEVRALLADGDALLEAFERHGVRLRLAADGHSLTDGGGRIHSRSMPLHLFARLARGQDAIRAALRAQEARKE